MNDTTECFQRRSRPTAVEYAAAVERPLPRAPLGGVYIMLLFVLMAATAYMFRSTC